MKLLQNHQVWCSIMIRIDVFNHIQSKSAKCSAGVSNQMPHQVNEKSHSNPHLASYIKYSSASPSDKYNTTINATNYFQPLSLHFEVAWTPMKACRFDQNVHCLYQTIIHRAGVFICQYLWNSCSGFMRLSRCFLGGQCSNMLQSG